MKHKNLLALCEGAIAIAFAIVLNYIKLFTLPQGGSIELSMLPILIYCYKWGLLKGIITSFAFAIISMLLAGAFAWGFWSMVLDYFVAFVALGVCGAFKDIPNGIYIGSIIAVILRYIAHFISGITIFRIYAPTQIFNITLINPYVYSALYNSYVLFELIVCLIIMFLLKKPIDKYKKKM